MADTKAKLTLNGDTAVELDVLKGTLGQDVIDIRTLGSKGVFTFDPGFTSTASCESKITFIDGDEGILLHRGFPIDQLATDSNYLEVCYILLNGEKPTQEQYDEFKTTVTRHTMIHEQITRLFHAFRRDSHPMAVMCGITGALAAFYHDSLDVNNPRHREIAAFRLLSKMPTMAAMCYKYSIGQPFVYPRNDLSYAGNFLNMMFSTPCEPYEVNPILERAMDRILILHADHERVEFYSNDLASVRAAFEQYPQEIACIIVEPVAGNMNCVPPLPEFLPGLRALCDEFGALLIIDEVMTGFRVALAGAQDYYGVEPDLTCLGKIIGGGMPVGAFGGRRDVMDALAPTGPVYQAGTLSGNPIAMAAGFACLNEVAQPGVHETLDELTTRLAEGLREAAEEAGIPLVVNHVGGMFGIFFTDAESVTCYQDVMACDVERFKRFFHMMLDEGVYLAPSAFEAGFMSVAHSMEDINNTIDAARRVFAKL